MRAVDKQLGLICNLAGLIWNLYMYMYMYKCKNHEWACRDGMHYAKNHGNKEIP